MTCSSRKLFEMQALKKSKTSAQKKSEMTPLPKVEM
jgi:hypothetical protein